MNRPVINLVLTMILLFSSPLMANAGVAGDINGDGVVSVSEVRSAISAFLGLLTPNPAANPNLPGDMDGNGVLSASEVQAVFYAALHPAVNTAPVANAGVTKNVVTGEVATLDGSGSGDANGDALTYSWSIASKPAGSTVVLSSTTVIKPTFVPDLVGSYQFKLVVNDGKSDSSPSSVTVNASYNTATIKIVLTGALPAATSINGAQFSLHFPANVAPLTAAGTTDPISAVKITGIFAGLSGVTNVNYTPAADTSQATLTVAFGSVNSVSQLGEIETIAVKFANGAFPATTDFTVADKEVAATIASDPINSFLLTGVDIIVSSVTAP